MKKKIQKETIPEKILKVLIKQPKAAEEIKQELKDKFGYNIILEKIRMALLRLLRREEIKRTKEGKIYKYHI